MIQEALRETAERRPRSGFTLALVVSLILNLTVSPALGAGENLTCSDSLVGPVDVATEPTAATPILLVDNDRVTPKQVEGELARVMAGVKAVCARSGSCSDAEIGRAIEEQVEKRPHWARKVIRWSLLPFRRLMVMALYSTTVVGPGVLTYYLASSFNLPEGQKIILGTSASSISAVVLGRAGSVLEKMIGPHVEQNVMWLWDPNESDSWGAIQKALNEKDRLSFSQVYNQIDTMKEHLMRAGDMVKQSNLEEAAHHYAVSILHSAHLFGGLHYYHPSTVSEARSWLPRRKVGTRWELQLSEEQKIELVLRVCREIMEVSPDEIAPSLKRDEMVRFAYGVMLRWLVSHPKAGLGGRED